VSETERNLVRARCALAECARWFRYDPKDVRGSSFPFCSPHCKGADLGKWVDEDYRIPSLPDLRGLEDDEDVDAV
jgi:endogenous inhibitor of DNA gyrase (YacG/DUF329 family)